MNRDELLRQLAKFDEMDDLESAHWAADMALLEFIDDEEITAAFQQIERWYA
jgi:hypothetical protein